MAFQFYVVENDVRLDDDGMKSPGGCPECIDDGMASDLRLADDGMSSDLQLADDGMAGDLSLSDDGMSGDQSHASDGMKSFYRIAAE